MKRAAQERPSIPELFSFERSFDQLPAMPLARVDLPISGGQGPLALPLVVNPVSSVCVPICERFAFSVPIVIQEFALVVSVFIGQLAFAFSHVEVPAALVDFPGLVS